MANQPVVYSTNDRHQLLMELARKVTQQVADNPHPDDYKDDYGIQLPNLHSVSSGK